MCRPARDRCQVPQPNDIAAILKAAGEATRLRIIALLAQGELSVKDLTEILGQSQPRVSRHLKLLVDARLVTRHAEGAWAYFRLQREGASAALIDWAIAHIDSDSGEFGADRTKLDELRQIQRTRAAGYFATIADNWDRLRSLHIPEASVEDAIRSAVGNESVAHFLDLGTGTGRMLELLGDRYQKGVGIDSSREMLAVARAKLDAAHIDHAQVRLGDIIELSDHAAWADLVMLHQVLHYFDDPGMVLGHVAQCLRPDARVLVVDFAPHDHEFLRADQAHRRLGLSEQQMELWAGEAGLAIADFASFPPVDDGGLTVCLWSLIPQAETEK